MLLSCSSPIVSGGPGKQLNNITTGKETLWSSIRGNGLRGLHGKWWVLPLVGVAEGLDSKGLNERLFKHGAAILCASDCDMDRPHSKDPEYETLTVDFSGSHSARFFPRVLSPISSYLVSTGRI